MKVTAINFSGTKQTLVDKCLASIKAAEINHVAIAGIEDVVGQEQVILFFWDGDTVLGVKYVEGMKQALKFKDTPIVVVTEKKPDMIQKLLKAGAGISVTMPLEEKPLSDAVKKAVSPVGSTGSGVKVEFVNPFIDSTVEVLETMAAVKKVNRKGLFLKKDYKMFGEISGVMGLSGQATGSVAVALSDALAAKLVAGMLGMDASELNPEEVHDGVGELINMISGKAKSILSGTEYGFIISLPTIVCGAGHEIVHKSGTPCIVIVMDADGEEFALQISLASKI